MWNTNTPSIAGTYEVIMLTNHQQDFQVSHKEFAVGRWQVRKDDIVLAWRKI